MIIVNLLRPLTGYQSKSLTYIQFTLQSELNSPDGVLLKPARMHSCSPLRLKYNIFLHCNPPQYFSHFLLRWMAMFYSPPLESYIFLWRLSACVLHNGIFISYIRAFPLPNYFFHLETIKKLNLERMEANYPLKLNLVVRYKIDYKILVNYRIFIVYESFVIASPNFIRFNWFPFIIYPIQLIQFVWFGKADRQMHLHLHLI